MRRILLAGVCLKDQQNHFESALNECQELCRACDLEVLGTITQQSNSLDPSTVFRAGKVQELATMVSQLEADGIVFYNPLTVKQASRISEACQDLPVIDRTALILDIFGKRARSKQAKMQTEVARLEYNLPKILAENMEEDHARGGTFNNRGAGEMRSTIIQRRYQARIQDLKKELKRLDARNQIEQAKRKTSQLKSVALVGYTNAGKSSLMNTLLEFNQKQEKQVYQEDMLFATLDTSIRNISYQGQQFLLYDTVGFVSDLPHTLVDAFKSTLDAARDADLLLEVIDANDPAWQEKEEVTQDTLKQIHADHIPILKVYNKMDLGSEATHESGIQISCKSKLGIDVLLKEIIARCYPNDTHFLCLLPYDKMAMISRYSASLRITKKEETNDGLLLEIEGPMDQAKPFQMYQVQEDI